MMIKYRLTTIHKIIVFFLLLLAVFMFLKPQAYSENTEGVDIVLDMLPEGDYTASIVYHDSPEGNEIVIYTEEYADSDNERGLEIARQEMEAGLGRLEITFHLDESLYDVRIATAMDGEQYYIESTHIQGLQLLDYDNYYLAGLFILIAAGTVLLGWHVPFDKYKIPAFIVLLGAIASLPLFSDFIFLGGDSLFHFTRIEGIYKALEAGEFPVRINPIQSKLLGNISASMYPQLFLYPVALMHMMGMSVMLGYKLLLFAVNIGTAAFSYLCGRGIFNSKRAGIAACVLYTFSLYRLNNVYFRAALGESIAMTFFPLVLWGVFELLWGERKRWYVLLIGLTGVIESHVLSFELCGMFILLEGAVWLFSKKVYQKKKRLISIFKTAVLTLLLNASFLVPFLRYMCEDFVVFNQDRDLEGSAAYFSQMFSFFPTVAGSDEVRGYTYNEMPITVGGVLAIGIIIFAAAAIYYGGKTYVYSVGSHCLVFGGISLIMSSWLFPWEEFGRNKLFEKLFYPLQFPWRFLGIASIFLCIVAVCGLLLLKKDILQKTIGGIIIFISLISAFYYFDSISYNVISTDDKMYIESSRFHDGLYLYANDLGSGSRYNVYTCNGTEVVYSNYNKKGSSVTVDIEPASDSVDSDYLIFPLYYYPGYKLTVNGVEQEVLVIDYRAACELPKEAAHIEISFYGFTYFYVADIINALTAAGLAGYGLYAALRVKKRENA
ncbi:MAG: YfhO family protein [Lachnospiraceae bacterium]|nr:YfhO family protein [Lachnospiraceae bacterium]